MWASETKAAIKRQDNCQPNEQRRRAKRQATRRTAEELAEMSTDKLAIISYRAAKRYNDPSCRSCKHNGPDRHDPVNPLCCFLVLGSAHVSTRALSPNTRRERREAAAADVRFVPELNGCLPFAARSGSPRRCSSVSVQPAKLPKADLPAHNIPERREIINTAGTKEAADGTKRLCPPPSRAQAMDAMPCPVRPAHFIRQ
jgi:hypothetical protein